MLNEPRRGQCTWFRIPFGVFLVFSVFLALRPSSQLVRARKNNKVPAWSESHSCCSEVSSIIATYSSAEVNIVCFDFDYTRTRQYYKNVTTFDPAFLYYLGLAKLFLSEVGSTVPLKRKIIWRVEDDATIQLNLVTKLVRISDVAVVGHSIRNTKEDASVHYSSLVPNFHFVEHRGFQDVLESIRKRSIPFESRKLQVFWAGSDTANPCDGFKPCDDDCDDRRRLRLLRQLKSRPWLNFLLTSTNTAQHGTTTCSLAVHAPVPEEKWTAYRGILDIDGYVDAWGARWRLESGSVVFQVQSLYTNYFSSVLVDGVHHVRIAPDLQDLSEKTFVIASNETRDVRYLSEIAENGRMLMEKISFSTMVHEVAQRLTTTL